jgi:hypothetical protein
MATRIYMGIMPEGAFPEDYWPEVPADQVSGDVVTDLAVFVRPYLSLDVA